MTTSPTIDSLRKSLNEAQSLLTAKTGMTPEKLASSRTVTTTSSSTPTTSGSLKDLSIGLAQQNGATAPTKGGGSIKDLSIGLAKGNPITQSDITKAQSGGVSLASLTAPTSTSTSAVTGATDTKTSNQTAVTGGKDYYSRYGKDNQDQPVVETPSYEEIQKQMMRDAQKQVNALHKYESDLLAEQQTVNQQNDRSTQAVNVLSGLAGSTEANIQQQKTTAQGQQANKQIMDQVNTQVQSVLANVRKDAQQAYQFERTQANADQQTRDAHNKEMYTKAQDNAKLLAQSGATADGYKATDPEGYQHLVNTLGSEELVKATFTLNRPIDQVVERKIEGGKLIQIYQNPLTGKSTIETLDLGLPVGYSKTIDAGDRILAIPDNWDGNPANLVTINKGLTPSQQASQTTSGTGTYTPGSNPTVDSWVKEINSGRAKISSVPEKGNIKNLVVQALNTTTGGQLSSVQNNIKEATALVQELIDHPGRGSATGKSNLFGLSTQVPGTDAIDFKAKLDRLNALLFLNAVPQMKGMGALTEREGSRLEASASTLNNLGVKEDTYLAELNRLKTNLDSSFNTFGGQATIDAGVDNTNIGTLTSPDGTQEVNIADLSPTELEEAKNAGWQ